MRITDDKKAVGIVTARRNQIINYPALDYDGKNFMEVKKDVGNLIEKFKLNNCVISKSSFKSYHALFFYESLSWEQILNILKSASSDNKQYKLVEDYGRLRIRVAGKHKQPIRIVDIVESPNHKPNPRGDFNFRTYKAMISKIKVR